jgi:hypothetical protein
MIRSKYAIACVVFGAMGFGATGCAVSEMDSESAPAAASPAEQTPVQTFKRATAAHAAGVLADPSVRQQLIDELRARGPVALSELSALATATGVTLPADAVPQVSLYQPAGGGDASQLLVAYIPAGNKHTWTTIPAFALGGTPVALDAHQAPGVPVIVINTFGRLASQQGIALANRALQHAGLQRSDAERAATPRVGHQTTRLDSIRLKDDEEPWALGSAEIYAVTSGVVSSDNKAAMQIVDMPYLDNDGSTYTPQQIILDWSDFTFQAANINLFEKDDNTSYQDLVEALISAVGAAGTLAGKPAIQAITDIANRIIAALPASWFANDDDYVDTFYTVQENVTYTGRIGASNNATVTLTPFFLNSN